MTELEVENNLVCSHSSIESCAYALYVTGPFFDPNAGTSCTLLFARHCDNAWLADSLVDTVGGNRTRRIGQSQESDSLQVGEQQF